MTQLPLDSSIRAEYADGFILDETELNDISPFDPTKNVFNAILNKAAETEHGNMVSFTVFWKNTAYSVDWTKLPDNARPIRFRHGYATSVGGQITEQGFSGVDFGYQYNDDSGKNQQVVQELR